MVAEEEENEFRGGCDEDEGEPVIQADPAFEDRLGESANSYPAMEVRMTP